MGGVDGPGRSLLAPAGLKIDRLIVMLAERDAELRERTDFDLFESRPASELPAPRSRKEPTISG